jgi:hypothetical protein
MPTALFFPNSPPDRASVYRCPGSLPVAQLLGTLRGYGQLKAALHAKFNGNGRAAQMAHCICDPSTPALRGSRLTSRMTGRDCFGRFILVAPELGRRGMIGPWTFLLRLEHGRLPPATVGPVSQGEFSSRPPRNSPPMQVSDNYNVQSCLTYPIQGNWQMATRIEWGRRSNRS